MTDGKVQFDNLLGRIRDIIESPMDRNRKMQEICDLLRDNVPYYDWVGFYLVDEDKSDMLHLGPFNGAPTEHTKIRFGEGICGQAADLKRTFLIQDVTKETNYLSCSSRVRSEIVVPFMKGDQVVGELDIDSHELSPFSDADRVFLEKVCELLGELFWNYVISNPTPNETFPVEAYQTH